MRPEQDRLNDYINDLEITRKALIKNKGELPDALQKSANRALQKIDEEINALAQSRRKQGNVVKEPYMGVIETRKIVHDEPVLLFGSKIRCHQVVEVSIYDAMRDTATGDIIKDNLLSQVQLTEKQFGSIMARTNHADNETATQTIRMGEEVKTPYSPERDPFNKHTDQREVGRDVLGDLKEALETIGTMAQEAKDGKGRLSKKDIERPLRHLEAMDSNAVRNIAFWDTQYAQKLFKDINEGAVIMHLDVRADSQSRLDATE